MAQKQRRLGRGLASLINEAADVSAATGLEGHRMVAIEAVRPSPLNPRRHYPESELRELAESIKSRGLVQPILVRPANGAGGGFEIIAGERRWRAAQQAALHEVPVIVRDLSDQEALELALIENVQRIDLNAVEEAMGYRQLIDRFKYSQDDLAEVVGKSRSHLANTLRLLKLPEDVQALIREGKLSAGAARPLIGLEDAEAVAREIVRRGLNVRDVEALIKRRAKADSGRSAKARAKDADTRAVEREIAEALGLKAQIVPGRGEAGELRIAYRTLEQFEDVRRRLLSGGRTARPTKKTSKIK